MQKISVKQFMAIKEAEVEFDKALVLIGEQASGKSTLSKLIYFFKSLPQDLLFLIWFLSFRFYPTDNRLIVPIGGRP